MIKRSRGWALNDNYAAPGDTGSRPRSIPGNPTRIGRAGSLPVEDALAGMLRGSRDLGAYIRKVVERRNRLVQGKLEQERPRLACPQLRCRSTSTTRPGAQVPSRQPADLHRLIQIRMYAERLEVYYKGHLVERMELRPRQLPPRHRLPGAQPGAFARYRFREQMFPTIPSAWPRRPQEVARRTRRCGPAPCGADGLALPRPVSPSTMPRSSRTRLRRGRRC